MLVFSTQLCELAPLYNLLSGSPPSLSSLSQSILQYKQNVCGWVGGVESCWRPYSAGVYSVSDNLGGKWISDKTKQRISLCYILLIKLSFAFFRSSMHEQSVYFLVQAAALKSSFRGEVPSFLCLWLQYTQQHNFFAQSHPESQGVLLRNGGFCNGCITKQMVLLQLFRSYEDQYYATKKKRKSICLHI